jgi:hypothetical protein
MRAVIGVFGQGLTSRVLPRVLLTPHSDGHVFGRCL